MFGSRNKRTRGTVLVWVALTLLILIGFIGLALDSGMIVLTGQQLQVGADAAALAGAQQVKSDQKKAQDKAIEVAAANKAGGAPITINPNDKNADPGGDFVVGRYDRATQTFTPQLTNVNAVHVVARRTASAHGPLPLLFGPIFNVNSANIEREAIAMIGGGTGAGLIALDPAADHAFHVQGDATVKVTGGDIQVNSSSSTAAYFNGSLTTDAPDINIHGSYDIKGGWDPAAGLLNTNQPVLPDPLLDLPAPTYSVTPNLNGSSYKKGTYTVLPGYYKDGISANGQVILNLQPGLYVLGGLNLSGGASINGTEIMIYLVNSGAISLSGNGTMNLTAPDQNGPANLSAYEGILIFQARGNTQNNSITGTAGMNLQGTLYFPSAGVELGGTCDKLGTQLIADTVYVKGSANLTINYAGNASAAGYHVFLVE